MRRVDANLLYASLRGELLRAARHHRNAQQHPHLARELHVGHLRNCQRQLGALRQAYRRTQEAVAWEQYKRSIEK